MARLGTVILREVEEHGQLPGLGAFVSFTPLVCSHKSLTRLCEEQTVETTTLQLMHGGNIQFKGDVNQRA